MKELPIGYDLAGRIANLNWKPSSEWALPILEAVSNSLHATELLAPQDRWIEVTLIREGDDQFSLLSDKQKERSIIGFKVSDNGEGFSDENFKAFQIVDTRHKEQKGGKGIGRLFWLKAFEEVNVDSTYEDNSKLYNRKIRFTKTRLSSDDPVVSSGEKITTIEVRGLNPKLKPHYRRLGKTLAREIANHFLPYFILNGWPGIFILNATESGNEPLSIKDEINYKLSKSSFSIKNITFSANHIKNYSTDTNFAVLCAAGRTVNDVKVDISSIVPKRVLRDTNEKTFSYICMLESEYLDTNVSSERTHFTIPDTALELFQDGTEAIIDLASITTKLLSEIDIFIRPYLEILIKDTDAVILSVKENNPELLSITLSSEDTRSLIGLSEQDITKKFRLLQHEAEDSAKSEIDALLDRLASQDGIDFESFAEQYQKDVFNYNKVCQTHLVSYVLYRRRVLDIMQKALEVLPTGKSVEEKFIHNLIFPMGAQGHPGDFGSNHNLWIIDDRLAHTDWIASDVAIGNHKVLYSTESAGEPDIVCYNLAYSSEANTDSQSRYSEIHIVEFKRPVTLAARHDPIKQIKDYIYTLKEHSALRLQKQDGKYIESSRHVPVAENAVFYGYAVFDQSEFEDKTLWKKIAYDHKLQKFMDGYICHSDSAVIFVYSYNTILNLAKSRNAVFFSKLMQGMTPN